MTKKILWTLSPTILGVGSAVVCLVKTTPLTMTFFFFIGIPSSCLGLLLWAIIVIKDLREHKVL